MNNNDFEAETERILIQFLKDHAKAQAHDRLQEHDKATNDALAQLNKLFTEREIKARQDQAMIDFDWYSLETDTPENELMQIRERILAEIEALKKQLKGDV